MNYLACVAGCTCIAATSAILSVFIYKLAENHYKQLDINGFSMANNENAAICDV